MHLQMIKGIKGDTFVSTENLSGRFDLGSTFYTLLSGNDMQQPRRVRWVDRIRSNWRYPCCNRVDQTKTSPYMQNFATIYALSCGEKLSPKVHLWRKKKQISGLHSHTQSRQVRRLVVCVETNTKARLRKFNSAKDTPLVWRHRRQGSPSVAFPPTNLGQNPIQGSFLLGFVGRLLGSCHLLAFSKYSLMKIEFTCSLSQLPRCSLLCGTGLSHHGTQAPPQHSQLPKTIVSSRSTKKSTV